jgi:hypothetical protein
VRGYHVIFRQFHSSERVPTSTIIDRKGLAMSRQPKRAAFLALAFLAALCVRPVAAQPAPNEAMRAAQELITIMRATDQIKQIMPTIMRALKPAIVQGRPEVERDYDTLMPLLLGSMNARMDELVGQMASVYARNFTPDEMRQLTAFYRSPLGQKLLEKMPTVMQESMSLGQAWGQQIGGELQQRMIDELRKKGHNI